MTRKEWALAFALFALDLAAMILATVPPPNTPRQRRQVRQRRRRYSERLRYLARCPICLENTSEKLIRIGREWAHSSCVEIVRAVSDAMDEVES